MISISQFKKTTNSAFKRQYPIGPLLTNKKIKRLLIHAITSYQKQEIPLAALTLIAEKILQQKSVKLPKDIENLANEVKSLEVVNDMLADVLSELTQRKIS